MSILATTPHAVPSLPIGLMPIAASPNAPIGAGEPFGFCDVITELETPLQPVAPDLPAAVALPGPGISLPAPVPVVANDAAPDVDVADVMIGAQPAAEPGMAPVLPRPIVATLPAPVAKDAPLTEAGPDIRAIPVLPMIPQPTVRPWVRTATSALTVARAMPPLLKGERASLPEKLPKSEVPAPDNVVVPVGPPPDAPNKTETPVANVASVLLAPETSEPPAPAPPAPLPAFAPVNWGPLRQDAGKREKAGNTVATPVVLFPAVARLIAQLPAADRSAAPTAAPVTPSPIPIADQHLPTPVVTRPIAQLPASEGTVLAENPIMAFPATPIDPGTAKGSANVPTPVTAKPIEPLPAQLSPELTRQIAQLLPPHTREPVEPAALTPAEPTIFPISAPTPAPIAVSTPQSVFTSQPAPIDTGRSAWMDAMIERIADMPQVDGKREAVIRLLPDQLGAVEVTVTERGDRMHVTMNADSAQARQMLSEAAPRLHELAEARGLRFAQTDVGGGQQQDRRPATEQQPQASQRPRSVAADAEDETPSQGDLIA